jgi:PAS domain S-box-containing protein
MNAPLRVLHLEDDPDYSALVSGMLEKAGLRAEMVLVGNLADFIAALDKAEFDIILGDYSLPTCTGIEALQAARQKCPDTPFLLVSGTIGEEAAIQSLKCGATDYVLKHWPERLVPTVRRAVQEARERAERKRAETELARRERYFRALTENSLDVLAILNREGVVQYNSPSVRGVLGYEPKDLVGRNAFELVHPDDLQSAMQAFDQALKHPELKITHECRYRRQDGSWCHLEVVGQNRFDDPEITGIVMNSRDITERKDLESQLRQAQKMEAIGQLAGGIAHDLNNILTPIVVSTALLRERMKEPEDEHLLGVLVASAQRGADIVRQLLWFGRGLEGKRILFNPKHVIKDVARFVSETFDKSIQILTRVPDDIWAIMGDPTHLHQVLLNLCLNSRDAMPLGGKLTVEARNFTVDEKCAAMHPKVSPGPFVILEVRDTGTGIPPAVLDRVFEPFFTTKEPGKGTGLGLSTALSIVKGYGGFIELESQAGKGTAFRVYLPARPEACAQKAEAEAPSPARGHGETVLVVDDEDSLCQVVQKTLENFGYRVLTACDGQKAVAAYVGNQGTIAVVLTDLMMPVMDGAATIRALKHINPQVKVIAASGLGGHPNHESLRGLGVKHFVSKPYATETILQELQEILAEEPGPG